MEVLVPVAFLLLWWMLPGYPASLHMSFSSHVEELNLTFISALMA